MDIEEAYILDAIDHHKEVITGLTMRLLLLRERKKCGMFNKKVMIGKDGKWVELKEAQDG